jgi:hypothetical protein
VAVKDCQLNTKQWERNTKGFKDMTRLTLERTCRACEEDGMIVKEFFVDKDEIVCQRCGRVVGHIDFIRGKLSNEPENYPR